MLFSSILPGTSESMPIMLKMPIQLTSMIELNVNKKKRTWQRSTL